ncbi:MAG: 50S ribosomal protein L21 [Limnochordales bacterium]|nr:50S ribosomal protein L21 [Limnochordales bacterium]
MYAIVETGGKQVKVEPGMRVRVEQLPAEVGSQVVLERVLLVSDAGRVEIGRPFVPAARVVATVMAHVRGPKIYIQKFHSKNNYRRRTGHRQPYTDLWIERIELDGAAEAAPGVEVGAGA